MKKLLASSLLLCTLASCTLPGSATPGDYTSLYNANIQAEMQLLPEDVFRLPTQEISGSIKASANFSNNEKVANQPIAINFSSDVNAIQEMFASEWDLKNGKMHIEGKKNNHKFSGDLSFDTAKIIDFGAHFLQAENLRIDARSDNPQKDQEMKEEAKKTLDAFAQAKGKWIVLPDGSGSISSEEAQAMLQAFSVLSNATPQDIEKLLVKYQFFTPVGEPTINGNRYTFPVALNVENTTNLAIDILDSTTKRKVSEEKRAEIKKQLQQLETKGTITFDTKNPLYNDSDITISLANIGSLRITSHRENKDSSRIAFDLTQAEKYLGGIEIDAVEKGDTTNAKIVIFTKVSENAEKTQIGQFDAVFGKNNLKTLNGNLNVGIFGGKLEYVHKDKFLLTAYSMGAKIGEMYNNFSGDSFSGAIVTEGKQIANWKVDVHNEKLKSLDFTLVDPLSSKGTESIVSLKLSEQDSSGIVKGPLNITLPDEQTSLSADISLLVEKEKFGFTAQNIATKNLDLKELIIPTQLELFINAKSKETDKKVQVPSGTFVPLKELFQ